MRPDALPASWFVPLFASALLAQSPATRPPDPRLQQIVQRALAELDQPERARDGLRTLENLGAKGVPFLIEVLQWQQRDRTSPQVKNQVVYVLGRLGADALPALPELRAFLRNDADELGRQSMWALTMLAPHLDADQLLAVHDDLRRSPRSHTTLTMKNVLGNAIALAQQPTLTGLLQALSTYDTTAAAASRWLLAHPTAHAEHRTELLAALVNLLQRGAVRDPVRWRGAMQGGFANGDAAEAWLRLSGEPLGVLTARALLDHWQPDQRRAAIAWMADHGRTLPFRERADLVARLWDSDTGLQVAAAEALGRYGRAGLVALPGLRLLCAGPDERTRAAASRAAVAILADCSTLPATDVAWLTAIDATLGGAVGTAPAAKCSPAGLEAMTEILWLAQWNDAPTLARVLSLVEHAGPVRDDTMQAVFGWLVHDDAAVVDHACAWLARRGPAACRAFTAGLDGGDNEALRRLVRWSMPMADERTSLELLAHLTVAEATTGEQRRDLLDDENSRIVGRGLASMLADARDALPPATQRLRQLTRPVDRPVVVLRVGKWDDGLRLDVDLSPLVRTLAAVALADLELEIEPTPGLDDVVRRTLGVSLAELPRHVADLRAANRLPALLDHVEDQCRLALGVPPHLRWPTFGGVVR
ncbi:MAG: hypothetical protein JNK15_15370 [Planctomycetes bacterium]|nr:hypothetical protein [Planctomycetota bacterium]